MFDPVYIVLMFLVLLMILCIVLGRKADLKDKEYLLSHPIVIGNTVEVTSDNEFFNRWQPKLQISDFTASCLGQVWCPVMVSVSGSLTITVPKGVKLLTLTDDNSVFYEYNSISQSLDFGNLKCGDWEVNGYDLEIVTKGSEPVLHDFQQNDQPLVIPLQNVKCATCGGKTLNVDYNRNPRPECSYCGEILPPYVSGNIASSKTVFGIA